MASFSWKLIIWKISSQLLLLVLVICSLGHCLLMSFNFSSSWADLFFYLRAHFSLSSWERSISQLWQIGYPILPRFWVWKCQGEMGLRQGEQGFSSFLAKLLVYLMIFQSGAQCKILKQPCSTCLKSIFRPIPGTQKSNIR